MDLFTDHAMICILFENSEKLDWLTVVVVVVLQEQGLCSPGYSETQYVRSGWPSSH